MKSENVVYTMTATGLFPCLISIPWATAEITPPPDNVDPGSETPTNPSLGMEITIFTMETISTDTTYDYQIRAEGTASDDVTKSYYSIWVYSDGESGPQQSWEGSPIDEEHTYGNHEYKEEFFGTEPEGSWSTWKWTFHSQGPIDDSNRARYEDPESYWGPIEQMLLYIGGYAEDGTWDQGSEDITNEYTGIDPSSADDDDTSEEENEGNDSPEFEISLIAGVIMITTIIHDSQKEKEPICKDSFPGQLK